MAGDLPVTNRLVIPAADLDYEYMRSSGPGGQHVNTAETAVRLRFDLQGCQVLHPAVKARMRDARSKDVTSEGELLITSQTHRSRADNIDEVRAKLVALVTSQLRPPKKRRKTKPTRASKRRRLKSKRHRGDIKSKRGKVKDW